MRAIVSFDPAANGTTSVIGLVGQTCAAAGAVLARSAAAIIRIIGIAVPLLNVLERDSPLRAAYHSVK
jgi:hypothetical protein